MWDLVYPAEPTDVCYNQNRVVECEGADPWGSWKQNWNGGVSTAENVELSSWVDGIKPPLRLVQNEKAKSVVVLTWVAAGAHPLSVYNEPEDQGQDGP